MYIKWTFYENFTTSTCSFLHYDASNCFGKLHISTIAHTQLKHKYNSLIHYFFAHHSLVSVCHETSGTTSFALFIFITLHNCYAFLFAHIHSNASPSTVFYICKCMCYTIAHTYIHIGLTGSPYFLNSNYCTFHIPNLHLGTMVDAKYKDKQREKIAHFYNHEIKVKLLLKPWKNGWIYKFYYIEVFSCSGQLSMLCLLLSILNNVAFFTYYTVDWELWIVSINLYTNISL